MAYRFSTLDVSLLTYLGIYGVLPSTEHCTEYLPSNNYLGFYATSHVYYE